MYVHTYAHICIYIHKYLAPTKFARLPILIFNIQAISKCTEKWRKIKLL